MKKIDIAKFVGLQLRLLALSCLVLTLNCHAQMTISIYQSGSDVKVDASGSLKIPFVDTSLYTAPNTITPSAPNAQIAFAGATRLIAIPGTACTRAG